MTLSIKAQTIVQRKPDALAVDIGGEVVLMSVQHGNYYGLDEIGSDIWRRIEQPIAVGELCSALAADYECDAPTIEHDVVALLEQLALQHLIVPVQG